MEAKLAEASDGRLVRIRRRTPSGHAPAIFFLSHTYTHILVPNAHSTRIPCCTVPVTFPVADRCSLPAPNMRLKHRPNIKRCWRSYAAQTWEIAHYMRSLCSSKRTTTGFRSQPGTGGQAAHAKPSRAPSIEGDGRVEHDVTSPANSAHPTGLPPPSLILSIPPIGA